MSRRLVRAVFALVVVATIAAFFVAQQLKSEFPLVLRFATLPARFSPNADGFEDRTRVGFDLSEPAQVTFEVVDSEGNEVRRIVDNRRLAGDTKHRFGWDGRDDAGNVVPDGTYRMRVVRRDESRVIDSYKEITVDTEPPRARLVSAEPSVIAPAAPGQRPRVVIRYAGPVNNSPEFRVFRTDDGPPRVVRRFRGDNRRQGVWDGRVSEGTDSTVPAPDGDYAFTVTVRDRAGNRVEAPARLPRRRLARPRTGVSVRSFSLRGPVGTVAAGAKAELQVGPFDRSFDFVLSRFGDPEPIRKGGRVGGTFRVRIPRRTRTGVYLVRVRAGDERAVWPLAVAGLPQKESAQERARTLVVLPSITWQGLNPEDDDADGFADTLPLSGRAGLDRPFTGGGLPPRFEEEVAPLLRWLEREQLAYDLTTDLALARREGPALGNAPGAVFAGSELWLPERLLGGLRSYVAGGGRVAVFGEGSFKRSVRLAGDVALDPSPPRPANALGERTAIIETSLAPLDLFDDELGLFADLSGFIGEFTEFEVSRGLPDGATLLTSAGREEGEPAFVAYELGDGLVVRLGTAQWAGQLEESALNVEIPQVTKRIWRLMAFGR